MIKGIIFDFNRTLFDPDIGKLLPSALEVLENLKRKSLKMGLVSYGSVKRREQLKTLGILSLFDWHKVVREKTQKVFREFLTFFSINPSEVLVVGDRLDEEIRLANELGMTSVWYNPKNQSGNPVVGPKMIIKDLPEIEVFLSTYRANGR